MLESLTKNINNLDNNISMIRTYQFTDENLCRKNKNKIKQNS